MEIVVGALVVLTLVSIALSLWSLSRAAQAEEEAASAIRIARMRDDWDRVHMMPNGQVRVLAQRGLYTHVVVLGKPRKDKH